MLAILTYATLTFVPMARLPSLAMRGSPRVLAMATVDDSAAASAPVEGVDKELTGSIIRLADLEPEFQDLCQAMLVRRDRARLLDGKSKYETVEGMIEAYVELGKPKGWTREEAESEVVRYLQRQALRSEGGLDGSAQDTPTFVLLAFAIGALVYGIVSKEGPVELWPNPFF
mmetsp:Transcript_32302/g.76934  ORF Transcript_32302/g.76934 Transcript_32302/m.76934 type:complete len:172 (-) Transcript_32302:114-629(-)